MVVRDAIVPQARPPRFRCTAKRSATRLPSSCDPESMLQPRTVNDRGQVSRFSCCVRVLIGLRTKGRPDLSLRRVGVTAALALVTCTPRAPVDANGGSRYVLTGRLRLRVRLRVRVREA